MPKKPVGNKKRRALSAPQSRNSGRRRRVGWYVRNAEDLRFNGDEKLTQLQLAAKAKVGRDAVSKIEQGVPVTRMIAERVFAALNDLNGGTLARHYVTETAPPKKPRR